MTKLRVRQKSAKHSLVTGLFQSLNRKPRTGAGERLAKIVRALNRGDFGGITGVNHEVTPLWGSLRYLWDKDPKRGRFVWLVFEDTQDSTELTRGIHQIIRLTEARLIHRVRECRCGNWFLAKRDNHKSCSDACRQDAYRTTPEGREKRSAAQRRYRQRQKHEAEAALRKAKTIRGGK